MLLAVAANATPTQNCNEEFERGKTASRASHFAEAEPILAGVLDCFSTVGDSPLLGNINTELAISLRGQGRYPEALTLFERALQLFEKDGANLPNRASALNNIASVFQATGNVDKAAAFYLQAIELWKQAGGNTAGYVRTLSNLASISVAQGDSQKAESLLLEATDRSASDPKSLERAGALNLLGMLYDKLGRPEAEELLREAVALREGLSGPNHMETAIVLNNLGHVLDTKRQYAEAEQLVSRAYQICSASVGPVSRCVSMLNNLACIQENTGRFEKAEANFKEAIRAYGSVPSGNLGPLAGTLNNLAKLYAGRRQLREAEQLYTRALDVLSQMNQADSLDKAAVLTNLGALRLEQHKVGPAEEAFRKALALDEALAGRDNWRVAKDCSSLAIIEEKRKNYDEANRLLQRAIDIDQRAFGPNSRQVAQELCKLAEMQMAQKRFVPAVDLFGRAFAIFGQDTGMKADAEIRILNEFAFSLRQVEDYALAEKMAGRAMTLQVRTAIGKPLPGQAFLDSAR